GRGLERLEQEIEILGAIAPGGARKLLGRVGPAARLGAHRRMEAGGEKGRQGERSESRAHKAKSKPCARGRNSGASDAGSKTCDGTIRLWPQSARGPKGA